jgi:glutamine synthetase
LTKLCCVQFRHVHVSLRNSDGKNVLAVSDSELQGGRSDAAYEDTKFISKEAEEFLSGILDGIADGNEI